MKLFIGLTLISTLLGSAQAATARQWQTATVTDISEERIYAGSSKDAGDVNGGTSAQYRHVWTYLIDAKTVSYVIKGDCGRIFPAPCHLAVNGPVQISPTNSFGRDGEGIYIKDDSGKEYKLTIAKKTLKP